MTLVDEEVNVGAISFRIEKIEHCYPEVEELMETHGIELSFYKQAKGPVLPLMNWYLDQERKGMFQAMTVRNDLGELVGYFGIGLSFHQHYRECLTAYNDTFYLKPEYRKGMNGFRFLRAAVRLMEETGADMLYLTVKVTKDYPAIMKRLGFVPEDLRYSRMLRCP